MKSLYESLLDDEDEILDKFDKEFLIKTWISQNYTRGGDGSPVKEDDIIVRKEGNNYVVDIICKGGKLSGFYNRIILNEKADSITNNLFTFGNVNYFCISYSKIKNLQGMPSSFDYFYVDHCDDIKDVDIQIKNSGAKIFIDYCSNINKVNVSGTCYELRCQACDNLKEVRAESVSGVDTNNCKKLELIEISGNSPMGKSSYIVATNCKKLKKVISKPLLHHLDCKGCSSLEIVDVNMCQSFNSVNLSKCKKITKWPVLGVTATFAVILEDCTSLTSVSQIYGPVKLNSVGKTLSFKGCSNLVLTLDDIPDVLGGMLNLKGVKECPNLHKIFMNKRINLRNIKMDELDKTREELTKEYNRV